MVCSHRGRSRVPVESRTGRFQSWSVVLVCAAVVVALGGATPAGASSPAAGPLSRACRSCVAQGVGAVTQKSAWVVGMRGGNRDYQTWIRQWNGRHWHNVTSPSPGTSNELFGVSGTSASDAWAAGYYYDAHAAKSLLEHWDGSSWTWVPGPLSVSSPLFDVSAVSPADVWAVGNYLSGGGQRTLIMHFDGTAWSQVASPNPTGASNITLRKVSADSATDAWAVGQYRGANGMTSFMLHWDGQSWTAVPTVTQGLLDVAAVGTTDAWAVGSTNLQTVTENWSGSQWSQVPSPDPGQGFANVLQSVDARSATDAWAAGFYGDGTTDNALILHWDGQSWTDAQAADPNDSHLFAISADSATDAWAIGAAEGQGNQHTLLEHWDGTSWTEG